MSEIKPVYQYQNEETGQIGFVDAWQVENGFFENNPRLQKVGTCYPAAAYEALQKENKDLSNKVQSLNFDNAGLSTTVIDWQRLYENSKAENSAQAKRIDELEAVVKANHEWHQEHDDYAGYPESELCTTNTTALVASKNGE